MLGAHIIRDGTEKAQAEEAVRIAKLWKIVDDIKCVGADTTSSNVGIHKGAIVEMEKLLGRILMYLACRHHVLELIVKLLFERLVEPSSGPDIGKLCKRFKKAWKNIDSSNFVPVTSNKAYKEILTPERVKAILDFAYKALEETQIRADYKYLLELSVIFLGGTPPKKPKRKISHFRPPIATNSARFMGRIIYCLSIYMFAKTGEFKVSREKLKLICDVNVFVVTTYLVPWYTATDPVAAPRTDVELVQNLFQYAEFSPEISKVALEAFSNHLWYLSPRLVVLALFDPQVPLQIKRDMVGNLERKHTHGGRLDRHIAEKVSDLKAISLPSLVNEKSLEFFKILDIPSEFLREDPSLWPTSASFKAAESTVKGLQVVNDTAERTVALVKYFNQTITKNESDFQNLLLVQRRERSKKGDADRALKAHFKVKVEK